MHHLRVIAVICPKSFKTLSLADHPWIELLVRPQSHFPSTLSQEIRLIKERHLARPKHEGLLFDLVASTDLRLVLVSQQEHIDADSCVRRQIADRQKLALVFILYHISVWFLLHPESFPFRLIKQHHFIRTELC
jgi:hypothetical protein